MSKSPANSDVGKPPTRSPDGPGDVAGSVTLFFGQLRAGNRDAANELWKRFFPRLRGLANKTLSGYPQRVADADDAAQSAFFSFWQRAETGEFGEELDRNNLWNLLGVITVRKALKQVEREQAQKRGGGQVRGETEVGTADGSSGEFRLDQVLASLPTREFDLYCEELLLQLNAEQREIALLRLWGQTNAEIASRFQCTERKIQRKLELIRLKWRNAMP